MSQLKTVVVGAGPVGALAALYAAQRGQTVEVYELRAELQVGRNLTDTDLRDESTIPLNFTKSINLTLSERGTNAIHHSGKRGGGILKTIVKETVPMDGRMIHGKDLTGELTNKAQAYDVNGRALLAADRGELNKILLDGLEQFPNVKLFFNHKLTGADFKNKKAWFEIQDTNQPDAKIRQKQSPQQARNQEVEIHFDFMIGADGAHSATRYHLMKYVRMDYQQEYIDTLWCEFTIPPNTKGPSKWAISPNHLHIWPAKDFMFIAIPSSDGSFTCTLFMPSALFESLDSKPNEVPKFFDRYFPGVTNVIQPDALINSYLTNPHLPLISIRCRPYHFKDCAVIIGDAAHAMVPFYGQGMNAGLEDVNVLYRILDAHPSTAVAGATLDSTRAAALDEYSTVRAPDAYSINELALQNYIEMRASVTSPVYKLRKWLEETLSVYAPELGWQTQYSRVSFGNEPYAQVIKKSKRQSDVLLMSLMGIITGPVIIGALAALYRLRRGSTGFWFRLFEQ